MSPDKSPHHNRREPSLDKRELAQALRQMDPEQWDRMQSAQRQLRLAGFKVLLQLEARGVAEAGLLSKMLRQRSPRTGLLPDALDDVAYDLEDQCQAEPDLDRQRELKTLGSLAQAASHIATVETVQVAGNASDNLEFLRRAAVDSVEAADVSEATKEALRVITPQPVS